MKRSDVRKFVTIPACETAEEFDVTVDTGMLLFKGNSVTLIESLTVRKCRAIARMAGVKLLNKGQYMAAVKSDIMNGNTDSLAVWSFANSDSQFAYLLYLSLSLEEKGIVL
jgi:hypothetical protein